MAPSELPTRSTLASQSTRSPGMSKSLNLSEVLPTLLTRIFMFYLHFFTIINSRRRANFSIRLF